MILITIFLYIVTLSLGIITGITLNSLDIRFTEDAADVMNSFLIIGWIIFVTGILLVLIKLKRGFIFFKVLEIFALFYASLIVINVFVPDIHAIILAVALVVARLKLPKNMFIKNLFATLGTAGVGAILGVSLGIVPILTFLLLLALYDYIAVFKTKHMLTLAEGLKEKNIAALYDIPTSERLFQLGTGDLAVSTAVTVSVWIFLSPLAGIMVTFGALSGLIGTMSLLVLKKPRGLPAIPLISLGIFIMLGLYLLVFGW